jgi:drug/metabolite transporter (DMT)-like permease
MPSTLSYLGESIAFGATLAFSIGMFPFTEASRRMGPNAVNHLRLVVAVLFLTVLSLLFLPISFIQLFSTPLPEHWIWFGLSGVLGLTLGDYFGFTAYAILGPRIASIFSTLAPTAALFAGYFIINERINIIGIIGIFITIAGVIWLTLSRKAKASMQNHEHGNVKKGIIFGALGALCQGGGVVLANKGFQTQLNNTDLPFFQATWIRMICAMSIMFIISIIGGRLKNIKQVIFSNKDGIKYTVAGTIFGPVIGVSLSMLTISQLHDKPSIAQTIFSLVPVFVLPISYFAYKEKITIKSILGALISIVGVIVLIWRDEIMLWF